MDPLSFATAAQRVYLSISPEPGMINTKHDYIILPKKEKTTKTGTKADRSSLKEIADVIDQLVVQNHSAPKLKASQLESIENLLISIEGRIHQKKSESKWGTKIRDLFYSIFSLFITSPEARIHASLKKIREEKALINDPASRLPVATTDESREKIREEKALIPDPASKLLEATTHESLEKIQKEKALILDQVTRVKYVIQTFVKDYNAVIQKYFPTKNEEVLLIGEKAVQIGERLINRHINGFVNFVYPGTERQYETSDIYQVFFQLNKLHIACKDSIKEILPKNTMFNSELRIFNTRELEMIDDFIAENTKALHVTTTESEEKYGASAS